MLYIPQVAAITKGDIFSLINNTPFYDPNACIPGDPVSPNAPATVTTTSTSNGTKSKSVEFDDSQSTDTGNQTTIDDDGIDPSPTGSGSHQSGTSYASGKLGALRTNFFALNPGWARAHGLTVGDVGALTYKSKTIYAVYGDNHVGDTPHAEISVKAALELTGKSNPRSADNLKGVHYAIFPGTNSKLSGSVDQSKIDQIGAEANGGQAPSGSATSKGVGPIYIMGDSITALAKDEYKSVFSTGGWTPTIEGLSSRQISTDPPSPSGLAQLTKDKDVIGGSNAIVVALGTNGSGNSPDSIKKDVQRAMTKIKSYNTNSAPVFWVNIIDTRHDEASKKTNDAITSGVGSGATVIDWYGTAKSKADLSSFNEGVHPTKPADIKLLTQLVFDAVNTGVASPPVATANSCCPTSDTTTSSNVSIGGNTNAEKAFNYFVGKGLSAEVSAGIVGNMMRESGGNTEKLDTHAHNDISGTHDGIIQWSTSRWAALKSHESGKDPYDIATQLDYVLYELNEGSYKAVLASMKSAGSASEAAKIFNENDEASGDNAGFREANATKIFKAYGNGTPSVSDSASATADTAVNTSACASGGDTTSTTTGGSGIDAYKNPLRDIMKNHSLFPRRIDEGVDYGGHGNIYAMGNGVVSFAGSGLWFSKFGQSVTYKLSDGPAAGKSVYFSESCTPKVKAGDKVTTDTVICEMHGDAGPWTETGWAVGGADAQDTPSAHIGYNECATVYGANYSDLLKKLGAPGGRIECGGPDEILPKDWPTW